MSLLADYHGPRTRSRALSIHQTSVYLGTAGGGVLAGHLGERYGWRSPFLVLGLAGTAYALMLGFMPGRAGARQSRRRQQAEPSRRTRSTEPGRGPGRFASWEKVVRIVAQPRRGPAPLRLHRGQLRGGDLPDLAADVHLREVRPEPLGLLADLDRLAAREPLGAVSAASLADWAARRRKGGRIRVQSLGLILGAPFVFLTGWSTSVAHADRGPDRGGLLQGHLRCQIFASLFDVVRPEDRGTAAGLMNTVGWTGGLVAPFAVGTASEYFGLGLAIASTAAVYLLVGILAFVAARLAESRKPSAAS